MLRRNRLTLTLLSAAGLLAARAWADEPAPPADQPAAPVVFNFPTQPPPGAIVLFSGKQEEIEQLWYARRSKQPGAWKVDADGIATPNHRDLTSVQSFGDCFVHVEFNEPTDAKGNPITSGNSGVGLMGRYEIQILNSYGRKPESHECGGIYSEKAPKLIASKKAGEWQTYDIIFRAPRFDADGKLKEHARVTVFQNGLELFCNEEIPGPTGIQYEENKGEVPTAPLVLQGDHDPVRFRSVWVVPL
jgi:hypothetical protein